MYSTYSKDRIFTDFVHQKLAIPQIYQPIGWDCCEIDALQAKKMDITQGVDYVFKTSKGQIVKVQERFRSIEYRKYSDFTIRYRRDSNRFSARQASEFYKMKADFFVYGITDAYKNEQGKLSTFLKFAVIDLAKIYQKIDRQEIVIEESGQNFCSIQHEKLICPIKHNKDASSSFFPIDIVLLQKLWGNELFLIQKGFF